MTVASRNEILQAVTTKAFLLIVVPAICLAERLILTSDEPVIVGSSITFYAKLEGSISHEQYTIAWQENYPCRGSPCREQKTSLTKDAHYTSNWTLSDTRTPGVFSITVIVTYTLIILEIPVASELYNYKITPNFTGVLEISQPGVVRKDPAFVSTFNETLLTLKVHDPSNYLQTAMNISYQWIRENNTVVNITSQPSIRMNFTHEDVYPLTVNLTASFNDSGEVITRYGSFAQNISAKVPAANFTINGMTWFRHGKLLDLTISCDGTPPYEYCWMIKLGPYNQTGNETCEPAVTTECSIHISRYLQTGTYTLLTRLNNDVGFISNQTGIHVYKTTTKPQLSIIIVPISCTLLAIVLIIFGVAYYWENHVRYSVEVADFDFGQVEEAPYVRFVDRLRDAVSSSASSLRGRRSSVLLPSENGSIVST